MAFGDTIAQTILGKPTDPVDTDNAPNAIAEGAAVNTTVGITAHSTFANGSADVDYSLSADSSGGGFKIDPVTGVVTVADPSKIDFESSPGHLYTITVLATKNNSFSSSQTFTISVNDVAPSAPVDSNAAANTVLEGAAAGTAVGITASSTDVNGGAVTYALTGDTSGGGFTINATTGVVTVADGSKIDFESAPGHAYTVTVQSSDGTLTSSQAFTINVGDVAMTTPVDVNGATNSVAEGAAAGTTVGITASATDPSGPATTYSLIGDTSGGGFTINASTGVVTVANPAKIDFESTAPGHTYNITVQASNGVQTTSQVFTVGVTDVAPSAPTDSNAAANTVVEGAANGTAVGVTASSTDVNGGAVTYSLTGDTSGGGFTINSTTGVITVADSTKINFETAPGHAYTVTAQASDGTLTNSQTFTIAVTDVAPSAPVDSNGATNTVAEGAANGSTVGVTAFSTDINGPGVTYSLVGDTSGGGFTINSTTGVITVADGTKLDYETTPSHAYTVTAQASDGTLTNSQTFTIALTDVAPSAPTDINGAANTVAEGAANGSTVGITASSVDPNGPATTYSLTDSAGGRFAIDSSTGIVTVANGAAIDFETAPGHAYGITVLATNGALATSSAFSIGVTDVGPSTPTDTNGAANSVFEGAANGTVVGITASSTDPGGGPAPTYTLTDSAGGRFAIDATTGIVTVANGAAIDFETAPGPGHSYGITVQSTAGALSTTQNFSIGVGDVNEAPAGTDKTVTMLEGDSYTFTVADFGFSDPSDSVNPNSLQAVKMTTVPGAGTGTFTNNGITVNANDFVSATDIAAGHLVFTPTAHSNGSPEASFTFQVQDNGGTANGGVDLDQSPNTVTINVNAVNDAPINSVPGTQSVNEDATLTFSSGTGNAITISDVDVGSGNETVTLTVTNGTLALGSHAGLVSFSPDNAASITLTGTIANIDNALNGLTYTGNLNFNGTETLVVSTNDNGNTGAGGPKIDSDPIVINVAAVNDAPVNTVPGAQTVNEDTNLVFTGANAISISDVDANGGNETVTLSVASGALTLNGTAGLAFTVGDGTADSTMTFSGTVAAINTALNGLIYKGNLNFNGSDTLNITTNDNGNTGSGGALSDTDPVIINVTAVNDPPVVTAGHTLNYTENQAATAFDPAITVSDVDNANLASATVQITGNYVNGEDVLGFTNQNGISGSFNAATGTLTLSGSSSVANYQTALASVTYVNTSDNPSGAARTVTIVTNDGTDNSIAATDTINVTPVNDAPVVTAGHTLNYTENQAATAIDPAITVSDVDSANLASATVQITGNYASGQDVLAFTDQNGITGSFNAGTGTLTLSGSSSVANYQAALASVTYVNTSDNPSGLARTVTIITNDGALNSVAATDTINVTPVNDAPVATAGHTLAYTENDPATAIDSLITVSDVDSANLASATVQITGNYVNGQDVLGFTNQNGITGSFNAATGTLTLSGSSSVANYQTALDSVTYTNTSDDPSAATRTVTIITNDGAANSVATTDTITVQPVNDAPTLTATGNNPNYSNGVDLFSSVTASTIEAGQSLDQLKLTVTNISGTATDSLTIDGTSVALTNGNVVSTSTPGVTATVAVSGSTATVTIDSTPGLFNSSMAALVDGLSYTDTNVNPGDPARVVTITQLHDTGGTSPGVDTTVLNITSTVFFDQAPVVTAGHTLNYTENQAATAFDTAITVTDADNANLASATVQITGGYVNGEDVLGFTNQNGISGSFNAATGTMTLTGSSSVTNYQTALASITYVNTSDNPSGAPRTVTITANDGLVNSTPVTDTINVTPVNDAPVVTAGHTLNYTENQAATAFDPAITVTDVDSANLASATVQITGNYANGQDVLGFTTQNGISGSFNAATGTLSLSGSSSVANYQTALASITYVNTSENPSGLARTVTIITNDGALNSVAKTDTINVTPVNDAPVTTAGGTLNYTENQVATAIDGTVTVSDVDSANLSSATVQLTTNYVNGQDILGFTTQNGITGVFNAATGTMTLSGSSSVANYQTALRSVTYFDNSDNPSGLDRTVVYTANDGALNSNSSTSTIHVTPVNDAPVVTATGTLAYTENQAATAIAPALTVTDADSTTLTTATVTISANYVNGEDVLAFTTQNGITGSFNAGTGTMTLTGTASVANYQTALESVTYVNTSENPSTAARTVTFTADDGQAANHLSAGSNHTITVASVDDAPVNNGVPGQFTVMSGFTHAITGLSITDVDAGSGNDITTTLTSVGTAFVTVGAVGGGAAITGNGTNAVTLTGTIGQINASLGGSVVYTAADNVTTSSLTTLTIATNDHGHTGTGGPITDTDVVSVGVTPQVWFIDQAQTGLVATEPRGSQLNPFSDVTEFNAASLTSTGPGNNDTIYIKAGTYTGPGINLKDGQTLLGDDQALSLADPFGGSPIVIETSSGARPTINVTTGGDQAIDLGVGNTIHGINITTAAGTSGLDDGNNAVGALTVDQMQISGAGQAVDIDQGGALAVTLESLSSSGGAEGIQLAGTASSGAGLLSGTFSVGGTGAISGSTTAGIMVGNGGATASAGGTVAVTYNGTVTTTGASHAVDIQDRAASAGNISLGGTISHASGNGSSIFLDQNASGTIAFSGANSVLNSGTTDAVHITNNGATVNFTGGGLNIDATSGAGFLASGGGTVNVTGTGNSIATTTGTALNIANTTIGASEVTFHDISSNGAPSGIILNTTGATGGLNVTGDNTAARDGSGGTITGSTGNGVSLTSTSQVSLQHMNINNSGTNGIAGSLVNGFVSDWNSLTGNGTAVNEGGIRFGGTLDTDPTGLTGGAIGSATETRIDHTLINTSFEHGLVVENTTGTLTQLNLTGTTIQNDGNGSGFLIETRGTAGSTAAATVQIEGSSFLANPGAGVAGNALRNTTLTMNILGNAAPGTNTFTGHDTILLGNGDTGHLVADIRNNTISGNGNGIFVGNAVSATSGATLSAKIVSNSVTTNVGGANHSISSFLSGGTSHLLIDSNTVVNNGQANGINVGTPDDPSGPNFTAIVTNNTVTGGATAANGISLAADVSGPGATAVFKVEGNTVNWSASNINNLDGIFMNQFGTSTVALERGISASNTASVVLAANNPNAHASAGGPAIEADGTITVVANGTITLPLLAALGGVAAATPAQAASTGDYHLTQVELDSVVAAAIGQWAAAGASASELAALRATVFSVADLSDNTIADEGQGHIRIDTDAAGHGWFVDSTPNDNSEFTHAQNAAGTDLLTDSTSAAAGHMDLLTAVSHEMGHVLGLADATTSNTVHDLMYIDLVDGERRIPDATDVSHANALDIVQIIESALPQTAQAAAGTPVVTGTAGNDTIDAGHGGNILFGGAGADNFVFGPSTPLNAPTPAQITHVADYHAAEGDTFDFSALTSAFHNSGVNDSLVVRAVEDASGKFATLQVDHIDPMGLPSAPNWVNVAQLDGAHAGDAVNVLIDNHSLHLAQIHVDLLV
jgi:large repetitive protein